ncbi:hypothetical protein [Steroidobacter gossypii]|uniref:hypothetical protein n=1 Tax=Steroidobacter gossypii TaxID=2805490 RepID=UPI001C3F7497|nr:hypothetical protein [Steroidobacter gossypii]
MNILENFRVNSPILRAMQALLCALFLLNLSAHFAHQHESKPSVSSERLICPYCCTFSAATTFDEPVSMPRRATAFCTRLMPVEERSFAPPATVFPWARGPPLIAPASSMSFS